MHKRSKEMFLLAKYMKYLGVGEYMTDMHSTGLHLLNQAISRSSQCSTTGVTKAVVCVILSVGWCI